MSKPLRAPDPAKPSGYLGPKYWKLVVGREGTFRVEPHGFRAGAYAAGIMVVAVLAVLWLVPTVPFNEKVAMFAIGGVAGAHVFALFIWVGSHERRLGPYLIAIGPEIQLRHDVRIPLEEFEGFVITRRWEPTGDGRTQVSHLAAENKSGEKFEILASVYHRDIIQLKSAMDERMSLLRKRRDAASTACVKTV